MSLRSLFVVNLSESKVVYHKIFRSVEERWAREHESFYQPLPVDQDLLRLLLNELGLLQKTTFEAKRDSCAKALKAPLFWVPHSTESDSVWPVVVTEHQNRLFCAVPFLKQAHGSDQPATLNCPNVAVTFEILCKLLPVVNFPANEMSVNLANIVLQWLPFGRPFGSQGLEILGKLSSSHKGIWMRSKPQVEVKIKEEVRAVITGSLKKSELYGAISLVMEQECDIGEIKLQLVFPKLSHQPKLVTHSSSKLDIDAHMFNIVVNPTLEKIIPMCHYSLVMNEPPIEAVFKTRTDGIKCSFFIQLHSNLPPKTALEQLEVHVSLPIRISRILTAVPQILGNISFLKGGSLLVWNLSPSTSSIKLKEDLTLNLDVETIEPTVSLSNTSALVIFSSTNLTVSGAQLTFPQPSKFKPAICQELKSSVYRIWNYEAVDTYT